MMVSRHLCSLWALIQAYILLDQPLGAFALRVQFQDLQEKVVSDEREDLDANDTSANSILARSYVGYDAAEHKGIGDDAWQLFHDNAHSMFESSCFEGHVHLSWFLATRMLELSPVRNGNNLSFGDYVFLSGDFFSDEKNGGDAENPRGDEFLMAHPLAGLEELTEKFFVKHDSGVRNLAEYVGNITEKLRKREETDGFKMRQAKLYWHRGHEYFDFATTNTDHFGRLAEAEYTRLHKLALGRAHAVGRKFNTSVLRDALKACEKGEKGTPCDLWDRPEGLSYAFMLEGYAAHYLTDLFASGHQRVPRTALDKVCPGKFLKFGKLAPIGGYLTKMMHDEDGARGLDLEIGEESWRAFGDGLYFKESNKKNQEKVVQAVLDGLKDVFNAFLRGMTGSAIESTPPAFPVIKKGEKFNWPPLFEFLPDRDYEDASERKSGVMLARISNHSERPPETKAMFDSCESVTGLQGMQCISCDDMMPIAEAHAEAAAEWAKHTV